MTTPRIRVVKQPAGTWIWLCRQPGHEHHLRPGESVTTARSVRTWADALAEGLRHLREHHRAFAPCAHPDCPICADWAARAALQATYDTTRSDT